MPTTPVDPADPSRLARGGFLLAALQLGLLMHAIRVLALEESFGLVAITPVVFFGFCVHAWTPSAWKLPLFLALSLAAFFVVLGGLNGSILVALALVLFGLCHAPVPFGARALLLAAAGALLTTVRAGWIEASWSNAVLPVLGSMFMFRAIVYMYDLRTEREPASIWTRLSYFFLLPNVCFLLFPVIDYRTFRRTYYEEDATRIHQRGLAWILRGIVHLLVYRAVYAHLTPAVADIQGLYGTVRFVLSSYLLYLRISGHFHLVVGLLHLFGFHLPETNHRYIFASSFTDTWRRINVYWTEFMKKIVYYPVFMRLRKRGLLFGVLGGTAATFVATWLLHSYQWFWLHGSFPILSDGLFWALAGLLAMATMVWESRSAAAPSLRRGVPSWGAAVRHSLQVFATFCLICLIWSLWCSATLDQWVSILSKAGDAPREQVLVSSGVVLVILTLGTVAQRLAHFDWMRPARGPLWTVAGAFGVALLGHAPVQDALGARTASVLASISADTLNARDRERQLDSYYDRLVEREGFGGRAWEESRLDPNDPEMFMQTRLVMPLDSAALYDLTPSIHPEFMGTVVTTNRWGMRDRDYELEKPAGTFRIALLGTCYEMGSGAEDDEVWETLAEERLAREVTPRTGLNYQVLNFAIPAYSPYQQLELIRSKVARFDPDVVVMSNHLGSSVKHMIRVANEGLEWPEELTSLLPDAEYEPDADEFELRLLLGPHQSRLEQELLGLIAAAIRDIGAVPVFMNAPFLEPPIKNPETFKRRIETLNGSAREAGFELLDIGDTFEGFDYETIAIVAYQHCPSATGQRLISDRFFEALLDKPQLLGFR